MNDVLSEWGILEMVEEERCAHRSELAASGWLDDEEKCLERLGFETDTRREALQLVRRLGVGLSS